jgi:hypothetical protein
MVTTPAAFAIVPEKSPTTTGEVGVYVVVLGLCSRFLEYSIVAVDCKLLMHHQQRFDAPSVTRSIYLGTATAAKIPRMIRTAIISMRVNPFSLIKQYSFFILLPTKVSVSLIF